ncbi:hypothetical protein ACOMHN_050188 [Nucella lapillus]
MLTGDSNSCTGGYTLKCGRCLNNGSFKKYPDAKQQCSDRLVMPKTLEDLQCVKDFFQSQTGLKGPFWVGAEDAKAQGQFTWSDGTPLPHNSDLWGLNQPSGLNGFHCVQYSIAFGKLEATKCAFLVQYICQKDCK